MTFTALVIGLGQIGMGYDLNLDPEVFVFTHARAFQVHPRFSMVGGVDADPTRCRLFEKHYSSPAYSDLNEALRQNQADVVVIATPSHLHAEILRIVLDQAQPVAILCEKPISYNLTEAKGMLEECSKRGCKLYVNYIRRSDTGVIEVERRLADGRIAGPIKGVVWYSKGLIHQGSHYFNLLQNWLGDVEDVSIIEPGRPRGDIDAEPDVQVKFNRGTITFLAAREEDFSHNTGELIALNGRLRLEQSGDDWITWQPVIKDPLIDGYCILSPSSEQVKSDMSRYQWNVADQLALSLDGETAHICTGAEALSTLIQLNDIVRMARQ